MPETIDFKKGRETIRKTFYTADEVNKYFLSNFRNRTSGTVARGTTPVGGFADRKFAEFLSSINSIGELNEDINGSFVTSVDLILDNPVRKGVDYFIINKPERELYVITPTQNAGPGEVTVSIEEQYIVAPSGSFITKVQPLDEVEARKLRENLTELNDVKLPSLESDLNDLDRALNNLDTSLGNLDSNLSELDDILDNPPDSVTFFESIATNQAWIDKLVANQAWLDNLFVNDAYADRITANDIKAGTITANEIGSNVITANEIDANAITANEIDANAITSNKIDTGAVTAAKISVINLQAVKANTGDLDVDGTITVGTASTAGIIKSFNFSSGSAGWRIKSDGNAEFNSGTFRGALDAVVGNFGDVDIDGVLTFGASGKIKSSGGNLDITGDRINLGRSGGGDGSYTSAGIALHKNGWISTPQFFLDSSGNMQLKNGSITGILEMAQAGGLELPNAGGNLVMTIDTSTSFNATPTLLGGGSPSNFSVSVGSTGNSAGRLINEDYESLIYNFDIQGDSGSLDEVTYGVARLQINEGTWTTKETIDFIAGQEVTNSYKITVNAGANNGNGCRIQVEVDSGADVGCTVKNLDLDEYRPKAHINLIGARFASSPGVYWEFGAGRNEIGGNLNITNNIEVGGQAFKSSGADWETASDPSIKTDLGRVDIGLEYLKDLGSPRWWKHNDNSPFDFDGQFISFDAGKAKNIDPKGVGRKNVNRKSFLTFKWSYQRAAMHNAIIELDKRVSKLEN